MSLICRNLIISATLVWFSPLVLALEFERDFVDAAIERTTHKVRYDGSYRAIDYPNGDVPDNIGVCTDVVIRSYRQLGVDLQQLVHEDMVENFEKYPSERIWGLTRTDTNIDHRRVPNLQVFFSRFGEELVVSQSADDYQPGDIVTWMLPNNRPHIGIISDEKAFFSGNPKVIHNIGFGPKSNDMLFRFTITGHFRFVPEWYQNQGSD